MNFVFEEEFDFKKELESTSNTNTCLITGNLLIDECKLECNHSFNYDSIFRLVRVEEVANEGLKSAVQYIYRRLYEIK